MTTRIVSRAACVLLLIALHAPAASAQIPARVVPRDSVKAPGVAEYAGRMKADFSLGMSFPSPFGASDPLANAFFPPELVMRHQQRIGLSTEQRTAIIRAIQQAQPRFIEAQWQLEPETAALAELVKGTRVDEGRVLQQIDRVLELERKIKRSQIELLVQIKNQLTEEQQKELARIGGARSLLPPGGFKVPGPATPGSWSGTSTEGAWAGNQSYTRSGQWTPLPYGIRR